jgi:hypothetical protein
MVHHLFNLIATAVEKMPSLVGSNWGGVVFTALLFFATEAVLMRWGEARTHWKRNTGIGIGVVVMGWLGLFALSAFLSVYDDHQNFVGATARIKRTMKSESEVAQLDLNKKLFSQENQLESAKLECARQTGQNDTLQKQNRDQQNSINGCLTQAMGLLKPPETKIVALIFGQEAPKDNIRTIKWLLLTNKQLPPDVVIQCTDPQTNAVGSVSIEGASMWLMGGSGVILSGPHQGRLNQNTWEVSQGSGAWTPETPLFITVEYRGPENIACAFGSR